ncbi:MAG: flavodoxin family protein [Sedimentisphaerales bacterium]|nr:flavodoxin family protein [Sedimentisphaerales bacterium]
MKNILAVVGSPRKGGNTDLLVGKMAEGAVSKGAQVDTLYLGKLNICECDGCHVCWKGKPCSKHDDMLEIYDKIAESDAFLFGTPVYWYGPTALMKAFIDRFVYFNRPENRVKIRGKSVALVIPFEEENPETARLTVEFFEKSLKYLELNLVGAIIAGGVSEKGDVLKKPQYLVQAYELGLKLA